MYISVISHAAACIRYQATVTTGIKHRSLILGTNGYHWRFCVSLVLITV